MILALDTESSYAKGRDIGTLGVRRYVGHPETHHYLVSLYSDGFKWVGAPEQAPWHMLNGATLVSHNAAYDQAVVAELRRRGLHIPVPTGWHCTADMSAFLQSPRALAGASRELLGIELSKEVRSKMKGRRWPELTVEEQEQVCQYALLDAKACYDLWNQHAAPWPAEERRLSQHTAAMCQQGVAVDLPRVKRGIEQLQLELLSAEDKIPWAGDLDSKGRGLPVTSPLLIAKECRRLGIEPPTTTDSKSEAWDAWEEANGARAPFVAAIQWWRRANRLLNVLQSMRDRQVDGVLSYGLKYFGAPHTGRWSGDLGLNLQNLPRAGFAGVDARACLVPRSSKRFIIGDFAQIEARIALWLAGDERTLELLRAGMDLYEAHARRTMGYADPRPLKEADKDLRQFAKCRVLGLGFGLGSVKFKQIVKQWAGKEIVLERAKDIVNDFRRTNPGIVRLWRQLELGVKQSRGGTFEVELPSGRIMRYFDVAELQGRWCGRVERGEARKTLYGGLLTENLVQATARDLFSEAILRLEKAGLPVVLHVHDEVVVEVDEADAAEAQRAVNEIMCMAPSWASGLPILVDTQIAEAYRK